MQHVNEGLACRLLEIRREMFGEFGAPLMAEALRLPTRTWLNYESGVTVTADVILSFLEITKTEVHWLRTGLGKKYRVVDDPV